ncbi:anti-sigma factor family protein [Caldisalinibacter kiritimatiensis]|uniref:Uncharacterized protein n=1 Tax=Caldisalinibacter kiritimatiensis TaxID=1304284 RepID=R1AUW2_9FIRM|nr:zf-HC2 domain-containing protein [Caldisalinibacter kiritimatiensis]EOD00938.1 hypothetical protein L21TH_1046 [Caldisalinibacter kiritimatiensis]
MECKEVMNNIDKYFEKKLDDFQVYSIEKHLQTCKSCREEYEEMEAIFDILSSHQVVLPPPNLTDKIMSEIKTSKKIYKIRQTTKRIWGASFIAAGLLIIILNISSIGYNIDDFAADVYMGSMKINQRIIKPFNIFTDNIKDFTNFLSFINKDNS